MSDKLQFLILHEEDNIFPKEQFALALKGTSSCLGDDYAQWM